MSKRTRATIFKVVRPWKAEVQAKRRKDAEVRQSAYSKLTDKQKLERLDKLHFSSDKERAKIIARLAIKK